VKTTGSDGQFEQEKGKRLCQKGSGGESEAKNVVPDERE